MVNKVFFLLLAVFVSIMELSFAQEVAATEGESLYPYVGEIYDEVPTREVKVNLRGGDGINYHILRVVTEGDLLLVTGQRGDWLEVELLPETDLELPVWVKRDYFSLNNAQALCEFKRVVMRAGASVDSEPVGYVDSGETLKVLQEKNNWLKVVAPQGTRSWISAKYVRFKENMQSHYHDEVVGDLSQQTVQAGEKSDMTEAITLENEDELVMQERSQEASQNQKIVESTEDPDHNSDDVARIRELFQQKLQRLKSHAVRELELMDQMSAYRDYTAAGHMKIQIEEGQRKPVHRLKIGERVTFLLTAAQDENQQPLVDLSLYSDKTIGVKGRILERKDGQRIIQVREVVILDPQN